MKLEFTKQELFKAAKHYLGDANHRLTENNINMTHSNDEANITSHSSMSKSSF